MIALVLALLLQANPVPPPPPDDVAANAPTERAAGMPRRAVAADAGADAGRRGNALYESEDYAAAADAYQAGLAARGDDVAGPVGAGLLNNLGAARHRQGQHVEAAASFAASAAAATDARAAARGYYNAGTAALEAGQLQPAVEHLRKALLADPDDENAKVNYEIARRRLTEQEQEKEKQKGPDDGEQEDGSEREQQSGDDGEQGDPGENQQQPGDDAPQPGDEGEGESGEGEQDAPEPGPGEQRGEPRGEPKLSRDEAARILQALENEEEELLRAQKRKGRARRVEKDW